MTSPAQQPGSSWDTRFDWMLAFEAWVTATGAFSAASAAVDEFKAAPNDTVLQETTTRVYLDPQPGTTLLLMPVGKAAANLIGDLRVWLYSAIRERAAVRTGPAGQYRPSQWHGMLACQQRFTLGTRAGLAGAPVPADALYADTIADTGDGKVLGTDAIKVYQASTAINDSAILAIDCLGAQRIGIDLRCEDAAAVNVLARWIGGG